MELNYANNPKGQESQGNMGGNKSHGGGMEDDNMKRGKGTSESSGTGNSGRNKNGGSTKSTNNSKQIGIIFKGC